MTILSLSDEIFHETKMVFDKASYNELFDLYKTSHLQEVVSSIKELIKRNEFVVLRNFPIDGNKDIFSSLVKQFGVYYGEVESTGIKIDCDYTGCYHGKLDLHNDDAISLQKQPHYGFITVSKEDPYLDVSNGVVVIKEVVEYLKANDTSFLDELLSYQFPMMSLGINYSSDKKPITTKHPILYNDKGKFRVVYDQNRIKYFYHISGSIQPLVELKLLYKFNKLCETFKREFLIKKNDILIFNNKTTLHDRSECSFLLTPKGFETREIYVSFAY